MSFPENFIWGAATAAFQVEGYPRADGAGESNWLHFCHQNGRIVNDDCPEIGSAQFIKYKDDVRLMKELGLKAYRFSLSWSRIFPEGDGAMNPKGFDYYNRLVDELLANGIQPWVTFFHWDMPQSLEERFGGWRNKEVCRIFGDYVAKAAEVLSDRVTNFFTVNEIYNFTDAGYGSGMFAPGLRLSQQEVNQTVHNGCLAHGYAMVAARAAARQPIRIGIAENPINCVPMFETEEHIAAARTAFRQYNASRLTLIQEGEYMPEYLDRLGKDAPVFTDDELKLIGTPMDFVAFNQYSPCYIMADKNEKDGFREVRKGASHPRMVIPNYVGPEIIYWGTRFCCELWPQTKEVYISENGCAAQDKMAADGEVYDTERVFYLREHFRNAQRLIDEKYPLKGYFVWSLLDNFEWTLGFSIRFGIVYVNYNTQERTPKLSAKFYREVIRNNHIL